MTLSFMMMNGFVSAMAYEHRAWGDRSFKQWLWFMGTRLARIYPLYFISWAVILYWTTTEMHWGQTWFGEQVCNTETNEGSTAACIVTSLFLCQSWLPYTFFTVNGPAWFLYIILGMDNLSSGNSSSQITSSIGSLDGDFGSYSYYCISFMHRDNPTFRVPEFTVGVCFGLLWVLNPQDHIHSD